MRLTTRAVPHAAAAMLLAAAVLDAHSASLQISPVHLRLPRGAYATALTLHNRGTMPLTGQVRVFRWRQADGADRLEPASTIVASPPIVEVPARADQLVRIVNLDRSRQRGTAHGAPADDEASYRLLIDELPSAATPASNAVQIRLRYSVPLFVGGPARQQSIDLAISLERTPAGVWSLRAVNHAAVHAQLARVTLDWPDGRRLTLAEGLLGYALAHASPVWAIDAPPAGAIGQPMMHALVNGVPVALQVALPVALPLAKAATTPLTQPITAPARPADSLSDASSDRAR